ncbi:MAG: GNAT family N-acetyltransferase [Alphaproteobacteria bacterium]|nr:GNAT family N-acetyltransferase [Alphaproteobacteria bacterium]
MSVIIRKALLSDVPALLDMSVQGRIFHNRLLDNYFADINPETEKSFLEKVVTDNDKMCFIALKDDIAVGMLFCFFKTLPFLRRPSVCHVDTLFVDEKCRNQGIGRLLMQNLKEICIRQGVDEIELAVYEGNDKALAFYHSMDFAEKKRELKLDLHSEN